MSIRLNGGHLKVDLTDSFDVQPATEALTVLLWLKKIGNFAGTDPFVSISDTATTRGGSIETFAGSSGATSAFDSGQHGSGNGHGSPTLNTGVWFRVAFSRAAGSGVSAGPVYCGEAGQALTVHDNFATYSHTADLRFLTIGELAEQGLVTPFNGEVARLRVYAAELTQTEIETEFGRATPVRTANLLVSFKWADTSDQTDQSGNGLGWTDSGTIANGASDPPVVGGGILLQMMMHHG